MPKYYVQSGNVEMILQAHDSRCAAIWAVHRTLGSALPFLCEETDAYDGLGALTRLDNMIVVSEQGFDRPDGDRFDTLEVIEEWNQLLVALDRMQIPDSRPATEGERPKIC